MNQRRDNDRGAGAVSHPDSVEKAHGHQKVICS